MHAWFRMWVIFVVYLCVCLFTKLHCSVTRWAQSEVNRLSGCGHSWWCNCVLSRAVPRLPVSHPGSRQRVFSVSSLSLASLNLGDSDSVHSEKRAPRWDSFTLHSSHLENMWYINAVDFIFKVWLISFSRCVPNVKPIQLLWTVFYIFIHFFDKRLDSRPECIGQPLCLERIDPLT